MIVVTFVLVLLVALGLGIYSRRGAGKTTADFLVGGRKFGGILLFILVVGEVYSIGTVIGFPGGVYAEGAGFAIWFMGYILLGYPIGYFLLPLLWKVGRKHNAMTLPDIFRGHFNSRALELVAALVSVVFLIPWAQLQLTGLTVALNGLGLGFTPLVTVLVGVSIALIFVMLSGIRAPAYVSYVKDFALIFAIVVVAVFVLGQNTSIPKIMADANVGSAHTTIAAGRPMIHTVSTMLFQAVGFFMFPFVIQAILSSKSAKTVRKTQIGMPIYMLMYPFLMITAYFAISAVPGLKGPDTNLAFIEVARRLLPDWLVGVVAGGAALCAIVVLAASSLVIGTLVSRNVLTGVKEEKQKSLVRVIIAIYLAVSIVLTLVFPNLMGALINTSYYGITQLAVAVVLLIAGSRVRPSNIAAGLLAGAATAVGIYLSGADLGGLNIGVPSLAVNVAIVVIGRLVWPAKQASEAVWVRKKHRLTAQFSAVALDAADPKSSQPVPVSDNVLTHEV